MILIYCWWGCKMEQIFENQSGNFFDDEQTFKIIRQRKNGMLTIRTANDRNIVYLFYRINMHDWHYVEKIDLDMLLASIAEKQKNKTEKH